MAALRHWEGRQGMPGAGLWTAIVSPIARVMYVFTVANNSNPTYPNLWVQVRIHEKQEIIFHKLTPSPHVKSQ